MQGNKEAIAAALVRCEHCGRTNRVPAAATGIPRCGNCHQPLPWIADAGDGTFAEIDEAPQLAQRFDVHAVPTLLILRKEEVTARQAGALPLPALRAWVEHALA